MEALAVQNGIINCNEMQRGILDDKRYATVLKIADKIALKKYGKRMLVRTKDALPSSINNVKKRKHDVAQELKKGRIFKECRDNGELYLYNPEDGLFHPRAETYVKTFMLKNYPNKSKHFFREVVYALGGDFVCYSDFNSTVNRIHLSNGIFNIETGNLEDFSPDYMATTALPVTYKKDADCPLFKKFISEVVPPHDVGLIQEIFGYTMLREYRYHKIILLVGDGRNGKSTTLEALRKMLGPRNCSSQPLQKLAQDRFAGSDLFGKFANVCAEIPSQAVKFTGFVKSLCGGDTISAEKKFKDSFDFKNSAKLIFSCNQVPMADDLSSAWFSRWIKVEFKNKFVGDDADVDLFEKITTPEELSGMFNWAVEGLNRLLARGGFDTSDEEEVREWYGKASSGVVAFIHERLEEVPLASEPKERIFTKYLEFCKDNARSPVAKNVFGRQLKAELPKIRDGYPTVEGKRTHVWMGIKLRDD